MAAQNDTLNDEEIDSDEKYVGENDLRRLKNDHFNAGLREGIAAGRQSTLQDGFNSGYKEAFFKSYNFGQLRGMLSAMSCYVSFKNKEKDSNNYKYKEGISKLMSELDSIEDDYSKISKDTLSCTSVMKSESKDGKTCQFSHGERTKMDLPEFKELIKRYNQLSDELGFDPGIVEILPQI